jgi:ubiquinone/menaquinone biosynthesis C-methylase UbiE
MSLVSLCCVETKREDEGLWKDYAEAYAKVLPHVSFYKETLNLMVTAMRGCEYVLDVGCGPGLISEQLAREGHQVIAIDNSPTMIEYCSKCVEGYNNVDVSRQDAHSLKLDDESFDGVVCNNLLYYVERPMDMLSEIHRVQRSNGALAISGPRPEPDIRLLVDTMYNDLEERGLLRAFESELGTIADCNRRIEQNCMKNVYENIELEELLKRVGFSSVIQSGECYLGQSYFIRVAK